MTRISFYIFRQERMDLIYRVLILITLVSVTNSCQTNRHPAEGISGKVLWFEGDLMPGIGKKPVEGIPVKREIYFYEPTLPSQAKALDQVFYSEVQTELVKRTTSDEQGNFRTRLEPGKYSVFVREPHGFFASRLSGEGYINLVEVHEQELTEIEIRIDYMAAY